eukprot:Gb_38508 [translate_table: standard]
MIGSLGIGKMSQYHLRVVKEHGGPPPLATTTWGELCMTWCIVDYLPMQEWWSLWSYERPIRYALQREGVDHFVNLPILPKDVLMEEALDSYENHQKDYSVVYWLENNDAMTFPSRWCRREEDPHIHQSPIVVQRKKQRLVLSEDEEEDELKTHTSEEANSIKEIDLEQFLEERGHTLFLGGVLVARHQLDILLGETPKEEVEMKLSPQSPVKNPEMGGIGKEDEEEALPQPGMVTTDLLMSGSNTKQAKFFINVLAEPAETLEDMRNR